ncbi:MAG: alpha/beta hydrolase [Burkholderiales bacterium]|nr:alpha/beta hydrolase [Burkholderiales bacterium]OJX00171.1 MAG: alpha/beta hydrolase [Burkholderiales bacterium 70-64]
MPPADPYLPRRESRSLFFDIRGLRHHVRCWDPAPGRDDPAPTLFLLHGWMDVSASFQFVADALPAHWRLYAPDWRGFGLSARAQSDTYWFPDYLGDLDALLDSLAPEGPADIAGHSMGGNVATLYAGVRPARVRRLVNLDGLGLPTTRPDQAPARYARWLDELKAGPSLRDYATRDEVAARLMRTNPRLRADYAAFLAQHWSRPTPAGRFELLADPVHRLVSPTLYRLEEVLACWRLITADVLWVQAGHVEEWQRFAHTPAYRRRLQAIRSRRRVTVAGAGHMLHHDRPDEVARLIEEFLA